MLEHLSSYCLNVNIYIDVTGDVLWIVREVWGSLENWMIATRFRCCSRHLKMYYNGSRSLNRFLVWGAVFEQLPLPWGVWVGDTNSGYCELLISHGLCFACV
jgi:hypothetical protein